MNKYYIKRYDSSVPSNSCTYYCKDKECEILHREDGPAVIWDSGQKIWYYENKIHREGGPAIEFPGGYKEYWWHGNRYDKKDYLIKSRFGSFA